MATKKKRSKKKRQPSRGIRPAYEGNGVSIYLGECVGVMKRMPANTYDSVVTDPPYELSFMSKKWDATGVAFDPATWAEALRVAKPGAFLSAFGGTRTYHRIACAIEDAGWIIRDSLSLMWEYGSGFPKSHNGPWGGTALKPAFEPIILARKPMIGTLEENFAKYGTGGLNIDGCRVDSGGAVTGWGGGGSALHEGGLSREGGAARPTTSGRWPANVVLACYCDDESTHDPDCPVALLDAQSGALQSGKLEPHHKLKASENLSMESPNRARSPSRSFGGDSGGASRFYYTAKPARSEREAGLKHRKPIESHKITGRKKGSKGQHNPRAGVTGKRPRFNPHPTIKPRKLMQWLVTLTTPPVALVCESCHNGLHGNSTKQEGGTSPVQAVRSDVQAQGQQTSEKVLQSKVRSGGDAAGSKSMRNVRRRVPTKKSVSKILRSQMSKQSDSAKVGKRIRDQSQGVQAAIPTGSSESSANRIHNGTPRGDGAGAGKTANVKRDSSSQKWKPSRQPPRESGSDAKKETRQDSERTEEADSVSTLRRPSTDDRTCPSCGSPLVEKPGLVLDPFGGSGTTGMGALYAGMRAHLIEMDPEYVSLAGDRLREAAADTALERMML